MKLKNVLFAALALPMLLVSCSDDDTPVDVPSGAYDNGVLILNQGNFQAGDASVSFQKGDFTVENNIFAAVNDAAPLGDIGQSISFYNEYAYIVVNNSHKVEVVNRYTFERVATISTGILNPRYIAFYNGKGYITNWGTFSPTDDFVAILDPATNTVTGNIPVGEGPEKILEEGGKLYVALKGGFNSNNKIVVINPATNAVTNTITVGDVPGSMEVMNGKLYVLGEGVLAWTGNETVAKLQAIDLATNAVTNTLDFAMGTHPSNMVAHNNVLYYTVGSSIYKIEAAAATLPPTAIVTTPAAFISGFAVLNNSLYVGDPKDYASAGKVYIYSLTGTLEHTLTAGIAPAGFYWNE